MTHLILRYLSCHPDPVTVVPFPRYILYLRCHVLPTKSRFVNTRHLYIHVPPYTIVRVYSDALFFPAGPSQSSLFYPPQADHDRMHHLDILPIDWYARFMNYVWRMRL